MKPDHDLDLVRFSGLAELRRRVRRRQIRRLGLAAAGLAAVALWICLP